MAIDRVLHLESDLNRVEEELLRSLDSTVGITSTVGQYIFQSGGKRIRPLLTLLSASLFGYEGAHHIPLAAAIELIHTATLLHDDVVDHSELRRGRRSVNYLWNSDTSILIGDFLFTRAFCIMVEAGDMKVLNLMSRTCRELAEGELLELVKCGDLTTTEEDYFSIVRFKTAVLIAAACQVGAILGRAEEEEEKAMYGFGMNLGIAFQIVDDALEFTAKEEELGKPLGKDLEEGKITLPVIHALRVCRGEVRERLVECIQRRTLQKEEVRRIAETVRQSGALESTMARARDYTGKAKGFLDLFPPSLEKDLLLEVANFVIERGM